MGRELMADAATAILLVLATFHLFWAFGGRADKAAAIPTLDDRPVISPTLLGTALVGVALIFAAGLVAATADLFVTPAPPWVLRIGCAFLATIFAVRAIGDFRFVGFFKRIHGSRFAQLDTWLYSPLCFGLAIMIGAVALG